jgi:predicted NBD/HSP70 family sugar kinase/mannose-6-phosphate isomerase class I
MFKHTNKITCGIDIGGTHISAALIQDQTLLTDTWRRAAVDPGAGALPLLDSWAGLINTVIGLAPKDQPVTSIGIAMPGPFDYIQGVSMIRGLNKYESLYGLNIREALRERLTVALPLCFENDAACFGLGEARSGAATRRNKIIAITLGTGLGACFIENRQLLTSGPAVPPNGYLYNAPFENGIAEDYLSARWLLNAYPANNVREIAERAAIDPKAAAVFRTFGKHLNLFITPWIKRFEADALVIGGSISGAYPLFEKELHLDIPVLITANTEHLAIAGAASLTNQPTPSIPARKTRQPLLPVKLQTPPSIAVAPPSSDAYDIYPFEPLGDDQLFAGYESLARWIIQQQGARLEGYAGIDWNLVRARLIPALHRQGINVCWYETRAWQKPEAEIDSLIKPFLGPEGSVWGTKATLALADLYLADLAAWAPATDTPQTLSILAGPGAGLSSWSAPIIYFDLPKNEIQYRMRAGSTANLATTVPPDAGMQQSAAAKASGSAQYKRSYFVDWPLLNEHRRQIQPAIKIIVDGQHEDSPNWAFADAIRQGLRSMAHNGIRARPWFEAGVWGGQWMKQHIPALSKEEINYAWSFELIAPENGLLFESNGLLLEIAFDWLMEQESAAVLGVDEERFNEEFPIRFDFLDTFGGGNLSIQCHPSLPYIKKHFGETITQDETYYILDRKPGAGVYLGFNEDIDPAAFRHALEQSQAANQAIDIEEYVQLLPAQKHDLFLIPNQTIHGSGINNLVLEISATPYIFTFKMYDWMRLDLDGMPRPINIEHAFNNLDFNRKGESVRQELVSRPQLLRSTPAYQLQLLPTHPEHFYSIHRITLKENMRVSTDGRCHLLMLVEGQELIVATPGRRFTLHFAETFVLPAAAGEYQLFNPNPQQPILIIKAFVK